ncbi:uncharacterized protein SPSK_10427 [Sporothrix schenckii 1099-18]|uniref:Uncharacterized protein n=1 Tax=Sporothrix schenckii 1099-18 TaxID=1397361 RepID=A0A0F2MBY4_SPOSC|nr:uncharacterized protein SPSK_10427 [Sporothrix schenckii 1099-18]KJR87147.1 hypothetical protein SPSK_10427 [Sporothrix schenckii 1099-18]
MRKNRKTKRKAEVKVKGTSIQNERASGIGTEHQGKEQTSQFGQLTPYKGKVPMGKLEIKGKEYGKGEGMQVDGMHVSFPPMRARRQEHRDGWPRGISRGEGVGGHACPLKLCEVQVSLARFDPAWALKSTNLPRLIR